jgi:hypothetical protein
MNQLGRAPPPPIPPQTHKTVIKCNSFFGLFYSMLQYFMLYFLGTDRRWYFLLLLVNDARSVDQKIWN